MPDEPTEPWENGEAHGLQGCPEDVCPYRRDQPTSRRVWLDGWRDGLTMLRYDEAVWYRK